MSDIVPLQAVPNQTLTVPLDGQNCDLNVYQKTTGIYIDVFLGGEPIILGVLCENTNRIIRDGYLGFAGDFIFYDTQGDTDPVYTGLGGRFLLVYVHADELPEN